LLCEEHILRSSRTKVYETIELDKPAAVLNLM